MVKIGDGVVYVDPHGIARAAVVTAVWPGMNVREGVNLCFVSDDDARRDNYGRQIERSTSVCHMTAQPAHGNYWRQSDESGKETEQAAA